MTRCPECNGYLVYEPEFMEIPARVKCIACGWMVSDPNFRKEEPRYFPSDSVDKRIEWQQETSGLRSLRAEKRGLSARHQRELPEILYQARPIGTGYHGAGLDCLQYSHITVVVG